METVLNKYCPNSGKPVEENSLTTYRDFTVGFCNQDCRNVFAKDPERESKAKTYFDVLIKEQK